MRISENLAALALRQVIGGTCKAIGVEAGEGAVAGVVGFLTRHFSDHSQRLTDALAQSNERAWKALEVALAGDSLWDRCKLVLARGEDKAFRDLVGPFLANCPLGVLQGREIFRRLALAELHAARKEGVMNTGSLDPNDLARRVGAFARFSDPTGLLTAELDALADVGSDLRRAGYENLGEFVALRPPPGQPQEPLLLLRCGILPPRYRERFGAVSGIDLRPDGEAPGGSGGGVPFPVRRPWRAGRKPGNPPRRPASRRRPDTRRGP